MKYSKDAFNYLNFYYLKFSQLCCKHFITFIRFSNTYYSFASNSTELQTKSTVCYFFKDENSLTGIRYLLILFTLDRALILFVETEIKNA